MTIAELPLKVEDKVFFLRSEKAGTVYTFGYGQHGALGHSTASNELAPKLVTPLEKKYVHKIAAGGNSSIVKR